MAATVWKGHLTFGLVSVPVRLHSAARSQTASFNLLTREGHSRIKNVTVSAATGEKVERSELVKGYEYEKDRYVVIEDDDIKKVAPKTSKVMEILEFVEAKDVDPVYLESSYYMAPEDGGEKPYSLLFEALKKSGLHGVARIAMHNREHIIVLRAGPKGIILHTMYFEDEVRRTDEFRTDTSMVNEKELKLAMMLVDSLKGPFEPGKYHDSFRVNIEQMIQTKLAGRKVVEITSAPMAPVIDIMEALKRSLEAKKPPASAVEATTVAEEKPKKLRKARSG